MPKLRKNLEDYTRDELNDLCESRNSAMFKFTQSTIRNLIDLYGQADYTSEYEKEIKKRVREDRESRKDANGKLPPETSERSNEIMLDYCKTLPDKIGNNANFAKQQLYALAITNSWNKINDFQEPTKDQLIQIYKDSTELENNLRPNIIKCLSDQQNIATNRKPAARGNENAAPGSDAASLEQTFIDSTFNRMFELQNNPIIFNFGIPKPNDKVVTGDIRVIHESLTANIGDGPHKASLEEMEKTNRKFPISNVLNAQNDLANCVNTAHARFDKRLNDTRSFNQRGNDLDILKQFQSDFKRESEKMFSSMRDAASNVNLSNRQEIIDNIFGGREGGFIDATSNSRGWKTTLKKLNEKTIPSVTNDLIYRKMEVDAKRFQDFTKDLDAERGRFSLTSRQAKALKASAARLNDWFKDFHEKQSASGAPKRMTPEQEKDLQGLYKDLNEKAAAYIKHDEKHNFKGKETRMEAAKSILNLTDPQSPNNVFQFIKEATPEKIHSKKNDEYVNEALESLNIVEKANKARLDALKKAESEKMFEGQPDADKLKNDYALKEGLKTESDLNSKRNLAPKEHANDKAEARSADNLRKNVDFKYIEQKANENKPQQKTHTASNPQKSNGLQIQEPILEI
ncbi:MAG: hypothetical protein J6P05_05075 [Lachnospiraceae bacterium]|nr:hypothetical protein [Lachnospiraceae bacterium]